MNYAIIDFNFHDRAALSLCNNTNCEHHLLSRLSTNSLHQRFSLTQGVLPYKSQLMCLVYSML